uniref:Uncharacterized protein n=1 Tax=Panagrolaimus superbus TaxID=310955 RepID=A0A914YYT8_9BILA
MEEENLDISENGDFEMDEEAQFYEEDPNAIFETSYLLTRVHEKDAVSVAISPTGKYVATGGCDDTALLFKTFQNLKLPFMVYKASDTVQELTFDSTESFLAYISGDDVNVIDLGNFIRPRTVCLGAPVSLVTWNPGCQGAFDIYDYLLAVVPETKYVAKIRMDRNEIVPLTGFYYAGETPTDIKMIPQTVLCLITFDNGLILMFNVDKRTQVASIHMKSPIHSMTLSMSTSFVVGLSSGKVNICSYSDDGKMKIVNQLGEVKTEDIPVEALCVSKNPSRPYLAFATLGGDIEVHDMNTVNGLRFKYSVGEISILSLTFDEKVDKLYVGCYDGTLYVFDVHSDKLLDVYYSRGKVNTFGFAMRRVNSGRMLACSVSSKGDLRYFLDPFPEEPIKCADILIG